MAGVQVKTQDLTDQEVIDTARLHDEPFEVLCKKYPRKIVEARLRKMASKGMVDWGVVIDRFWIVPDKGMIDVTR